MLPLADSTTASNYNKKPSIILIHGFRGAPAGLKSISDELTAVGYDVYIPAIPPFAGAPKLPSYTPDSYADFMANYIRKQNLTQPILIGHSMGSIIAAATANKYPEIVNHKLVLMSPISIRTPKFFSFIAPLQNFVPRKLVDYVTTRYLFVPHDHKLFKQVMTLTGLCSDDHPPTRKETTAVTKFSTKNSIGDFPLAKDILFLAGKKDRVVSNIETSSLAQKFQAKTVYLDNSGHLLNYEKPHETAMAIINFLKHE